MEVSMDGLRWQLLGNYNALTRKLNNAIDDNEIKLSPSDIQKAMDNIRSCIVTLAYMYHESEFEILDNPTFEEFNPID
jgi:hypothetical protein